MEHSKDTTDAVNPLFEKKSNENSGNSTSPSPASQASTSSTNIDSGGGPVSGRDTNIGRDLIVGDVYVGVAPGVAIRFISPQEFYETKDLDFTAFTSQVDKQLTEKHVFVLYGHTRHGKRHTALHLLSKRNRIEYIEIDPSVDWQQLDKSIFRQNRGYFIDTESAGNQVKLILFTLRRLNPILEELNSYLVIAVKNEKRFLELEKYILKPENLPCPYRGLFAFKEKDEAFFFGRETITKQLVQDVSQKKVVVVLGASGSGKSSVVFAGLVPELRRESKWIIANFRPGSNPFKSLMKQLLPLYEPNLSKTDLMVEILKAAQSLKTGEISFEDVITGVIQTQSGIQGPKTHLLLIADQFEELYTLCKDQKMQEDFLDVLLNTIELPDNVPLHLVLTLRADFMSQALKSRLFSNERDNADLKLKPMTRRELELAITKPAEGLGVYFEKGLVERILDDVKEEAGSLPLLEFALTELWQRRTTWELTHNAYKEIEGVQGALTRRANQVYAKFHGHQQEQVRRIFTQLVTPGQGTEDTRRVATRTNLGKNDWPLTKSLADNRLVVTNKNEDGEETVEIVHEALIQNWKQLQKWIKKDRNFRTWQDQLRVSLNQWLANDRDDSILLRDRLLVIAKGWLAERKSDLSPDEIEYIELSVEYQQKLEQEKKQQEEERRIQRTRLFYSVLLFILAVIAVIIFVYLWQDAEVARADAEIAREESEGLKLASNSQNLLDSNYDLALLLAIEATDKVNTLQTNTALRQALRYQGQPIARITDAVPIKQVLWNPVEPYFMTVSDRQVKVWQTERLESLRLVHEIETESTILHTAWRPDGQYFAIATQGEGEKTTQIWKRGGKEAILSLEHNHDVNHLAWNKEGDRLATASANQKVTIWDVNQLEPVPLFSLKHEAPVDQLIWSQNRSRIVTISGRQAHVWNIEPLTGTLAFSLDNDGRSIDDLLENHDETRLLTVDNKVRGNEDENNVYIWDAQTGEKYKTLPHQSKVNQALWSDDGKRVLTASEDGRSRIWDIERQEVLRTLVGHEGAVNHALWSQGKDEKDQKQIMTSGSDGTIRLWEANSGQEIAKLTGHQDGVNQAIWNPDEDRVVSVSQDKTVRVWNPLPGEELHTLKGHLSEITYVAWNQDGTQIVTASTDKTAKIWDAATGEMLHHLEGHERAVNQAVWSPAEKYMITVANEDVIRFWDATNGTLLTTADQHNEGQIKQADWYDKGTELLVVTASTDSTARTWSFDPPNPDPLHTLRTSGPVNQAVWNADGSKVATVAFDSSEGEVRVWNSATGEQLLALPEHNGYVGGVDWHPDGTKLVTASEDETARIWNITDEGVTQRAIHTLAEHTGVVRQATWSPNGKRIVTASDDGIAIIWDAENGRAEHILRGHSQSVNQANWNKDGTHLVTASNDKTARIWNATQGEELALLEGHDGFVNQAVWDQEGRRIVTAGADGTARIYYVFVGDLHKIACQRAVRNMSEVEWQQFMGEDVEYEKTCPGKAIPASD